MLRLALLFLLIAIAAGSLGLHGVAWLPPDLAKAVFFVFLMLFVLAVVAAVARDPLRDDLD